MNDSTPAPRKKLKVDLGELTYAMDFDAVEGTFYLDLHSGEVHLIEDDLLRCAEDDDLDDAPEWEEEELAEVARAILEDTGERFAEIPHIESSDSFELMQQFISGLEDSEPRRRLEKAIAAAKPFRHFKDALLDFPDLRERWFAFDNRAKEQMAREWLDKIGVDLIES